MGIGILLVLVIVIGLGMAAGGGDNLQNALGGLLGFIEIYAVPFILGLAFLIFVFNAIRFFVIDSTTDEGRENAKNLALYSIGAFVFILSFWGLINLLSGGIGLDNCGNSIVPDYLGDDYKNSAPCTPPETTPTGDDSTPDIPLPIDTPGLDPITDPISV